MSRTLEEIAASLKLLAHSHENGVVDISYELVMELVAEIEEAGRLHDEAIFMAQGAQVNAEGLLAEAESRILHEAAERAIAWMKKHGIGGLARETLRAAILGKS